MSQPVIKINTRWTKEISFIIILLFVIKTLLKNEFKMVAYVALIFFVVFIYKKMVIPSIKGAGIYFLSILIMSFYGFFINGMGDLVKGTFYVINNLLIVIAAYYACRFQGKKSLLKTLYLACSILLIMDWLKLLLNISSISTLGNLRDIFSDNIMDVLMFAILIFYEYVLNKRIIFGKIRDLFFMTLALITVMVSLGRTQILCMIVGVFISYFISIIKAEKKQRLVLNLIISTVAGVLLICLTFAFLPEEMTTPFVDKVENSLTEISTDNEFKDESSISSNWRGYENKNAKEQWREANILEEIFGEGIGTKIKLKALPETHKKMYGLTDSSTPLLHNGYYTLLIKGGLLSIVGLLIWLLYPLMIFRPKIKSNYLIDVYAEMLIVNIMMLIVMYVIRGLVGSGTFTVWAVIIGWNSCRLKQLSL